MFAAFSPMRTQRLISPSSPGYFSEKAELAATAAEIGRNLGVAAKNGEEKALLLLSHIAVAVYAERGADLVCGLAKLKLPKTKVCVFQRLSPQDDGAREVQAMQLPCPRRRRRVKVVFLRGLGCGRPRTTGSHRY